jgi:hypothetical protein
MTPKVSMLWVTYGRDLQFFKWSLLSVQKFCTGFCEHVVVVPSCDVASFQAFNGMVDNFRVVGFDECPGKGMLHHEALIMSADKFCTGDYVLHVDADVIFWEPTKPEDYFVDGKPVLYRELFENFRTKHPLRYGWKYCVIDALGIDPEFEVMVRHPAIHPIWLYRFCRDAVEAHTQRDFMEYMLAGKNDFPQSRAEFPTLGAYAYTYHPAKYHWVDFTVTDPNGAYIYEHGRDKCIAFWSHHGAEHYRAQLEEILK